MKTALYWFARDLRIHDNPALAACAAAHDSVYAVFCLAELRHLNSRQRNFVISSLHELRAALAKRNATLTLLDGEIGVAISGCARRLGASAVWAAGAYARSERQRQAAAAGSLADAGIALHLGDGDVVHQPESVAQAKQAPGEGYRVFPPFYEAWKALEVAPAGADAWPNGYDAVCGPLPERELAGELRNVRLQPAPGERAALQAVQAFAASRAADYAVNGQYPSRNGTSQLSAALRFGCVSARTLYRALSVRMTRSWVLAQERLSMQAFLRKLALRDFFIHLAYFAPEVHDVELQEKMRGFAWSADAHNLRLWVNGATGYPLVDAAMRQLRVDGHVHQRAAAVAASFCCFDLGLDWRLGRDVWMSSLVAADEALCDGNWQWIAGVGSDQAAYPRIYNPLKQARYFDAQAVYVRRYCPELAKLPTAAALEPWQLARQQQVEFDFYTPGSYPRPVVEHEHAARSALARYHEYRER